MVEKNTVMDYLDFITEESIKTTYGIASTAEEEAAGGESFAEVLAEKAAKAADAAAPAVPTPDSSDKVQPAAVKENSN